MKCLPLLATSLCFAATTTAAAQTTRTTAPATQAADASAAVEMFDGGRVRLTPPAGWKTTARPADGLSARYDWDNGRGLMVVVVTPQETAFQPQMAPQMAQAIAKRVREAAESEGSKLLYGPRVEPDDRFFLKLHDRQRLAHGEVIDRLQIYRLVQLDLVHVVVVAYTDSPEAAAPIHAAAETMLERARSGSGPRPASYRRTRIRLTVPPDWVEQRSDQPNGLVATFARPGGGGGGAARIVVRSKIAPKAAREEAARREVLLDELVDDERHVPIVPGAGQPRDEERYTDPRYLRAVRRVIEINGKACQSDLRCLQVGDVLVAVAAIAPEAAAMNAEAFGAVSKLADELAASIKPLGEK